MTTKTKGRSPRSRLTQREQFRLYGLISDDRDVLTGNPDGHSWASLAAHYGDEMGVVVPVSTMTTAMVASGIDFPVRRGGGDQTAMHRVVVAEKRLKDVEARLEKVEQSLVEMSAARPDASEQTAQAISESSVWVGDQSGRDVAMHDIPSQPSLLPQEISDSPAA